MMKISTVCLLAAMCMLTPAFGAENNEATVKISTKNLAGRQIVYHRSHNGVYLTTFTPVELTADSTFTLTLPTEGVERVNILARDPNNQLPYVYQTFYALPGVTEVVIDPLAKENVVVVPPTGNSLDAKAAQSADNLYDLWFHLATGRKDKLGLWADSIPTTVSTKLNTYADSINQAYAGASAEIRQALENDTRLESLMVYSQCTYLAGNKGDAEAWKQELGRIRNEVNMSDPANARNPFFAQHIVNDFYFKDNFPDGDFPQDITPDSLLQLKTDYFLNTLSGKAAESALGTMLYEDGATGKFSPGMPALTEQFKKLFPESGLIPLLDEKVRDNFAFNHPNPSDEIVFLDNTEIKSLSDLLAPYKGKPILIDLWATWCGPCRESFAHIEPIQKYAEENGIQLLYISIDDQPNIEDQWKRMANYYNLKGHHLLINPDLRPEIFSTFGTNGSLTIPQLAIVNRDGEITVCPQSIATTADFTPLRNLLEQVK
ncbi:MAG: redoxin family protein [Muribaculaceae bacterium]|nr:redoxin family protein [Muribaculaceae bacterium]